MPFHTGTGKNIRYFKGLDVLGVTPVIDWAMANGTEHEPFRGRVARHDKVLVRELGGEAVLLNLESESYFGLDEVGARMYAALTASDSIESACRALFDEFDVEEAELRTDLAAFVQELAGAGLVVIVDAPPEKAA